MNKKRIIGVVTIKDNFCVQSFGYKNYLPIGNPTIVVKNLNDWSIDEILIQCIDRSIKNSGPNFNLLEKITNQSISTPIIYSGGIRNSKDAELVIKLGADRIVIDNILHNDPNEVIKISESLGSQAIIASLPITKVKEKFFIYNYLNKKNIDIDNNILNFFNDQIISECLLIDVKNEGSYHKFNEDIAKIKKFKNIDKILFGGINNFKVIKNFFKKNRVKAIAVGNYFNYKENCSFLLSKKLQNRESIVLNEN